MTREERAREAAALAAEGLNGIQIAERMGVSQSYAYSLLSDPDGTGERERKAKYSGTCLGCGKSTSGSDGFKGAPDKCVACSNHDAALLADRVGTVLEMVRLRNEEGLLAREIAERVGRTRLTVKAEFNRMRALGFRVDPGPYNNARLRTIPVPDKGAHVLGRYLAERGIVPGHRRVPR